MNYYTYPNENKENSNFLSDSFKESLQQDFLEDQLHSSRKSSEFPYEGNLDFNLMEVDSACLMEDCINYYFEEQKYNECLNYINKSMPSFFQRNSFLKSKLIFLSILEEIIIQKSQDINILIRLKNEYQSQNIKLEILNLILNSTDTSLFSSTFFKQRLSYYSGIIKLSILNSLEEVFHDYINNKESLNLFEEEVVYYLIKYYSYDHNINLDNFLSCCYNYFSSSYYQVIGYIEEYLNNLKKSKIKFIVNQNVDLNHLSNTKRSLVKLDSLKSLHFKILKRENVDKKILRFFKKDVAKKLKYKYDIKISTFFKNFLEGFYFPPFIYDKKKFQSFNTSYIIWLFSHQEIHLYWEEYINTNLTNLIDNIVNAYNIEDKYEISVLESYLTNYHLIYSSKYLSTSSDDLELKSEYSSYETQNSYFH